MSDQARVADVATIERFRAALVTAAEAMSLALEDAEGEVDRTVDWLERDRMDTWKKRIRKGQDEVVACKSALFRKQEIKATADARPSVVDERKALERAQRRLEFAEERLRASKKWAIELPRQAIVFKGALAPMQTTLDRDVPQLAAMMRRMSEHLEDYLRGGPESERVLAMLGDLGSVARDGEASGDAPAGGEKAPA
jgi:hypothetical protein